MPPAYMRGARPQALCGCEDPVPTSLHEGEIIREKLRLICAVCDVRDRNAPWGTRDLNEQANDTRMRTSGAAHPLSNAHLAVNQPANLPNGDCGTG